MSEIQTLVHYPRPIESETWGWAVRAGAGKVIVDLVLASPLKDSDTYQILRVTRAKEFSRKIVSEKRK